MIKNIKVKDVLTDLLIFLILVYQSNQLPYLFLCLFFTLLLRVLAMKVKSVDENTFIYIVSLVLASKLIFKVFYNAYPDFIAIILLILALVVMKNRVLKWSIPVMLIIGTMINEGIIIYFAPVILAVCIYEGHKDNKPDSSLLNFIVLIVSLGLSVYYLDIQMIGSWFVFLKDTVLFLLPVLPVAALFVLLWMKSYKNCTDKTIKSIFMFCLCQPFIIILVNGALLYNSYSLNTVFLTQFCFLFYFLWVGEKSVLAAAEEIKALLTRHFIVQFLPLAYLLKYNVFAGY